MALTLAMADSLAVVAPSSFPITGIVMDSSSSSVRPGSACGVQYCAAAPPVHRAQTVVTNISDRRKNFGEFIEGDTTRFGKHASSVARLFDGVAPQVDGRIAPLWWACQIRTNFFI